MISIIGMACEFAGAADSLDNYYNVIINNIDATSEIDINRWNVDISQLPAPIVHGGYLRRDPWGFDHHFFGITPKEGARMDPQHRLLLEITYHAFEDAHLNPDTLKGKNCGVFIGLGTQDYARLMHSTGDFPGLHSKGSLGSMAAGRISYHFDFTGPTFVVDTACSSSLVALHQAITSLSRHECDIAVVGGITQILTIDYSLDLVNAGMLAPDGHCKPFSKYANGFARGEGAGVIILERHNEASLNKRRVYANILGSAINGDGRSNGITAPSQESQERLIKQALKSANLDPDQVIYVETHGTGTNLGDKIEFSALSQVFKGRKSPLYLGSVKGNIAHCEAAAGIAGVIKSGLCIYQNKIPPHKTADSIEGDFAHGSLPVTFLQDALPHDKIIAAISSFGMSGSNAHVLLGPNNLEKCKPLTSLPIDCKTKPLFLFLSAKSAESLALLATLYHERMKFGDDKAVADQANLSKKHWPQYRVLVHGASQSEFMDRLSKLTLEKARSSTAKRSSKIAYLFTGQSTCYSSMTKLLYENVKLYQEIFDQYAARLDAIAGVHDAQLTLFLMQHCLAIFFASLGVKPEFMIGQGVGEYAALSAAGMLTFENAIQMILKRPIQEDKVVHFSTNSTSEQPLKHENIHQALEICYEQGVTCFIEMGSDVLPTTSEFMPIVTKGENNLNALFDVLHYMYASNLLDLSKLDLLCASTSKLSLPSYPFNRTKLVPDCLRKTSVAQDIDAIATHLELEIPLDLADPQSACLKEHVINGLCILPGSYYIETAIALFDKKVVHTRKSSVQNVTFFEPVIFPPEEKITLKIVLSRESTGKYKLSFFENSNPEKPKCTLTLVLLELAPMAREFPRYDLPERSVDQFYKQYTECGVTYGPAFTLLKSYVPLSENSALAKIELPLHTAFSHTRFLDNCFQTIGLALDKVQNAYAPMAIASFQWTRDIPLDTSMLCHAEITTETAELIEANLTVFTPHHEVVIEITGIVCHVINLEKPSHPFLHSLSLQMVKDAPASTGLLESFSIIEGSETPLPECFKEYLELSQSDADQIIYMLDSGQEVAANFQLFSTFLQTLKELDDRLPGKLKCIDLVSCSSDALARAIALVFPTEFPTISFRSFCFDALTSTNVTYLFDKEITQDKGLSFFHVRDNSLYQYQIASLEDKDPQSDTPGMKKDGHYLVTGGLSGVGKHVISYMVSVLGLRKILITIRSEQSLTCENRRFLDNLRAQYEVDLQYKIVDLSRKEELILLFQEMPRPLYGIFHLAGITIDQPLSKITQESFSQVAAAKLHAALDLHELSQDISELGHFVLFSSMAAAVPSPGQLSYAYANIGLISLAEQRIAQGLPATVIAWGPWANTGMMAKVSKDAKSSAALSEFDALQPSVCCAVLGEALAKTDAHCFAVFKQKDKVQKEKMMTPSLDYIPSNSIHDTLLGIIAEETNYERNKIGLDVVLSDLGIDSINIIRVRAELQSKLGVSIPLSHLRDDASVASIIQALQELKRERETIASTIQQHQKIESEQFYPLSHNQFSIWYEQLAVADTSAYHCSIAWKISGGPLAVDAMERSWAWLLENHEMLRARLLYGESELGYQIIQTKEALEKAPIHIETIDDALEIEPYFKSHLLRQIDFFEDLPTQVILLYHRNMAYLMVASHHIAMDAVSIFYVGDKLLRSLCDSTTSFQKKDLSASYHDFVESQKNLSSEFCQKATQFLFNEIIDENHEPRKFELPKNIASSHKDLAQGNTIRIQFTDDEMQTILSIPASQRVHTCLSAWTLLLARYSGEKEILTGIAFNGRTQKKWSETVGHFVNVLPLCVPVDQTKGALSYMTAVKEHLFELMDIQDFPLMKLLMDDKVKKLLHGNPLLQTYFNYFDASQLTVDLNNAALDVSSLIQTQQEAQFEISLWIVREKQNFAFDIKYRTALLSRETILFMSQHYKQILLFLSCALLNNDQEAKLRDVKLLEEPSLQIGKHTCKHEKFVYEHFSDQVACSPFAIAIEKNQQKINYQQLSEYVDELAANFTICASEETVAIMVPEKANVEFIITVLMLWKAGFAYLPLNTHHPIERIRYMMQQAGCKKIINVDSNISDEMRTYVLSLDDILLVDVKLVDFSLEIDLVKNTIIDHSIVQKTEQQLAYILFTSGSTGMPKGVLVEHNGLIDRLLWMKRYFNFTSQDKFLQSTVLTFDISIPEFCLPLISGGTCVLFDPEDSPAAHAEVCRCASVTMMSTVPSLFGVLQHDLSSCKSLKHIILVGETLPPAYVNQWLQNKGSATLYNLYGPTEATIYATYYACHKQLTTSVPIGAPCDNVILLVLDSYGNLAPKGVAGELYLSGEGIARGYIGFQQKSNPFKENPFQDIHSRIYKTGDFARWLEDNTLEYLGRKDTRVKLHGLLIELGEIEQLVLQKFPSIKNAAALIVEFDSVKHIVLCVMPVITNRHQIHEHLEAHLPKYMLPWKIVTFTDFPRNSSNKIDRKALGQLVQQDIILTTAIDKGKEEKKEQTLSPLGAGCLQLWKKILQKESLSIYENFFDLGGDSLLLTKMILLAERELSIKINFAKFLTNPTIDAIITGTLGDTSTWQSEMQLCQMIAPFEYSKEEGSILLTGAAGHLGIHLLHAFFTQTKSHVHVIIRSDTLEGAQKRIAERYESVFSSPLDSNRLHVHIGDLSLPQFGMPEEQYATLCLETLIIVHAAAEVNHTLNYARLKASNVLATKHILEMAHQSHCRHLLYVSTQFTEMSNLPESYLEPACIQQFSSGYEQSKFMAEVLMSAAVGHGYPVSTFRLPLIIDGSDPGLFTHNHFVQLLMKCLQIGYYPDSACSFDILPTQAVAQFIVKTAASFSSSKVYNCLQSSTKLIDIFEYLDLKCIKISYDAWRKKTLQSTSSEDPFYRLLPHYTTSSSPLISSHLRQVENSAYSGELESDVKLLCNHLVNSCNHIEEKSVN